MKISVFIVFLTFLIIYGCSSNESSKKINNTDPLAGSPYAGWQTYVDGNVKILYPPGHPNESDFPNITRQYSQAIRTITGRLKMPPYNDTLLFIYYTGYGQGRGMTGREYPFATDTAIHFWLPSFPGPTLMQYLLPRWVPKEPQFKFLKHGLIAMFDFSGQPYHESTIGYYNKGKFMRAEELAADTTVNSNTERYQSAMAASFVAYMMGDGGVGALKNMYGSDLSFEKTVDSLFHISVDSLNKRWLYYISQAVPKDSIIDSLWEEK